MRAAANEKERPRRAYQLAFESYNCARMGLISGARLGPCEIVAPVGAGGMGEVYRAPNSRLGRDVAIKVLPSHLSSDAEARARFEREARVISALQHPDICAMFDIAKQDGMDFFEMEYLEGETLAARLSRELFGGVD